MSASLELDGAHTFSMLFSFHFLSHPSSCYTDIFKSYRELLHQHKWASAWKGCSNRLKMPHRIHGLSVAYTTDTAGWRDHYYKAQHEVSSEDMHHAFPATTNVTYTNSLCFPCRENLKQFFLFSLSVGTQFCG